MQSTPRVTFGHRGLHAPERGLESRSAGELSAPGVRRWVAGRGGLSLAGDASGWGRWRGDLGWWMCYPTLQENSKAEEHRGSRVADAAEAALQHRRSPAEEAGSLSEVMSGSDITVLLA